MLNNFISYYIYNCLFCVLIVFCLSCNLVGIVCTSSSILFMLFYSLLKILLIFLIVAFFTLAERKILGAVHRRRGPYVVGLLGLLQPIADALKLFFKELLYPLRANHFVFLSAPWWILNLSVLSWFLIPFHSIIFDVATNVSWQLLASNTSVSSVFYLLNLTTFISVDITVLVLVLLSISSLNVYGIILAGWSSNSKYAFLGGLRSAAQMVSYEVSLGLTILPIMLLSASLGLEEICLVQRSSAFFVCALFPSFIIFLISMLAETNRTPFDLPEAEAELVAGYNVEYSAITFAMFFLGEYSNMLLMSTFCSLLFFGGFGGIFHVVFPIKILVLCFFFVVVRASVPRLRYDQLMQLCWKAFLPLSLSFFTVAITLSFVIYNVII